MNRAEKREALIRLHTTKLVHARLLGCDVSYHKAPTRMNVHLLQVAINRETKK